MAGLPLPPAPAPAPPPSATEVAAAEPEVALATVGEETADDPEEFQEIEVDPALVFPPPSSITTMLIARASW